MNLHYDTCYFLAAFFLPEYHMRIMNGQLREA